MNSDANTSTSVPSPLPMAMELDSAPMSVSSDAPTLVTRITTSRYSPTCAPAVLSPNMAYVMPAVTSEKSDSTGHSALVRPTKNADVEYMPALLSRSMTARSAGIRMTWSYATNACVMRMKAIADSRSRSPAAVSGRRRYTEPTMTDMTTEPTNCDTTASGLRSL